MLESGDILHDEWHSSFVSDSEASLDHGEIGRSDLMPDDAGEGEFGAGDAGQFLLGQGHASGGFGEALEVDEGETSKLRKDLRRDTAMFHRGKYLHTEEG